MNTDYELKKIDFFGRTIPIITQNQNGPCPLIAICNVLLLRGLIKIDTDYSRFPFSELNNLVANHLMECNASSLRKEDVKAVFEKNIGDAIAMLPSLQYGLDVNIRFTNVKGFEYTPALTIFDLLDIDLVHGWIVDKNDIETYNVIKDLTYNHLMERLVIYNQIKSSEEDNEKKNSQMISTDQRSSNENILKEGYIIELFLKRTASQMTYTGLYQLHEVLRDNQLCVLFRNNHFSTLFKYKGEIYSLMTDSGYLHEPIVWEKLNELDNDTSFCTHDFNLYQETKFLSQADSSTIPNIIQNNYATPSDSDIRQQLLIEEGIERERKLEDERNDLKLAIEIHNEEIRNSQELQAQQKALIQAQSQQSYKEKQDKNLQQNPKKI